MRRAILIAGGLAFVGVLISGAFNSQICIPCLAIILGAAAGFFACRLQKPADQARAVRLGAGAGALAGVGALAGNVIGGTLGAYILGPANAQVQMQQITRELGITTPDVPISSFTYYLSATGTSACCGIVEVCLMALLGALAGVIWFRMTRDDMPPAPAGL